MDQMTLDALFIGNAVDHGSEIRIGDGHTIRNLGLNGNDLRLQDDAPDQPPGFYVRSYYGCHMTLRRSPRRCRENGRNQHQYKTRSHRIVSKNSGSRKH
jgi:hypothetical protein